MSFDYQKYIDNNQSDDHNQYWDYDRYKTGINQMDRAKNKTEKILQMYKHKKAISRFVKIITDYADIPVLFASSKTAVTNGKAVVLGGKLSKKNYDATVGLALHEGSHILLTDFDLMKNLYSRIRLYRNQVSSHSIQLVVDTVKSEIPLLKNVDDVIVANLLTANRYGLMYFQKLFNLVEDLRIDKYVRMKAPGYRMYYMAMLKQCFLDDKLIEHLNDPTTKTETWANYDLRLTFLQHKNVSTSDLMLLKKLSDFIDAPNIDRLKSSYEVFELCFKIYSALYYHLGMIKTMREFKKQGHDLSTHIADVVNPVKEMIESLLEDDANIIEVSELNDDELESEVENNVSDELESEAEEDEKDVEDINLDDVDYYDVDNDSVLKYFDDVDEETNGLTDDMEKAMEAVNEFLNGNVDKANVSDKDLDNINELEKQEFELEENAMNIGGLNFDTKLIKYPTHKALGIILGTNFQSWKKRHGSINEGYSRGKLLAKKVKAKEESKNVVYNRQKTGKIDRRMLHSIGAGKTNVFKRTIDTTSTPVNIHFSLDISYSMGSIWGDVIKLLSTFAKAVSISSHMEMSIDLRHYPGYSGRTRKKHKLNSILAYDSRKQSLKHFEQFFSSFQPDGNTSESFNWDIMMNEYTNMYDPNKNNIFINISDGEPNASSSANHISHARSAVKKLSAIGYTYSGFLITNPNTYGYKRAIQIFKEMYGNKFDVIDTNNINQISNVLNKLIRLS